MFPLHYKTRRFFCRVGFVLLGLVPTAGVLAWAGWLGTAAHLSACRREIERESGFGASLAAVTHPLPGVAIFEGLELIDPTTRERLLYLPRLEYSRRGDQRLLIAIGPELHQPALARLGQLVEQCWQDADTTTTLVTASLILRHASVDEKLKDVDVRLLHTTEGAELKCQFRRQRTDSSLPIKLHVVRQPPAKASLLVQLDTAERELPCALAAPYFPCVSHWGADAGFHGTLNLLREERGWQGEIQGKFVRVDLARAIAANFPHRIDGLADVHIERAVLADNRLLEICGGLNAGPGLIGPSLRAAAAQALELEASEVALQSAGLLEYEQLAFDFQLDSGGLVLNGRCAQAPPGALLIDRRQLLLGQPLRQPQPASALIRALAPPAASWVPANSETAWLLQLLPPTTARNP
jgi:hypothetical protein